MLRIRKSWNGWGLVALGAVALVQVAGAAAMAATLRFDVSFSSGDSGAIVIDSGYVLPGAQIPTDRAQVTFTFGGLSFTRSQAGATAYFQIDSSGSRIAALQSPGPGRVLPFAINTNAPQILSLSEGAVPGTFETRNLPGGDISGSFVIAPAVVVTPPPPAAPVPLPASGWGGLGALAALGALRLLGRQRGRGA